MDVKALDILGAVGVVMLTVLLTFIARRLDKVLDNQTTQGTDIAVVKSNLESISTIVTSLNEWRNRKQEEELTELKEIIQDLKHPKE